MTMLLAFSMTTSVFSVNARADMKAIEITEKNTEERAADPNRVITAPPTWLDQRYGEQYEGFYTKCITIYGIPICSTSAVPDEALYQAYDVVKTYLRKIHRDYPQIIDRMVENQVYVMIVALEENNKDHPSWADYDDESWPRRGGGGVNTTVLEEDLIVPEEDTYLQSFAGLVHEFSHTVLSYGIGDEDHTDGAAYHIYEEILAAYQNAMEEDLYTESAYDRSNYHEYWCGQVCRWFNGNPTDLHVENAAGLSDREQLEAYDPMVYRICEELFGAYELPEPWGTGVNPKTEEDVENSVLTGTNLALDAKVSTSFCSDWENLSAVNDNVYGATSAIARIPHYGSYGNFSSFETVTYTWEHPKRFNGFRLFLWNDNQGIHTPSSYTCEYLDSAGTWRAVENPVGYEVQLNKFNVTSFKPVIASALRIRLDKQKEDASGIGLIEWQVFGDSDFSEVYQTLDQAIAEAEEVLHFSEEYTEESVEVLRQALKWAEEVRTRDDALQDEFDFAAAQLKEGIQGLEKKEEISLPFLDVDRETGGWYYEEVAECYEKGIMRGMGDDGFYFAPYETCSRAQFALVLYRLEGEPETNDTEAFPDVESGSWYGDAVSWAAQAGIVTGYSNGNFGPADQITREQMGLMLYRYAQYQGKDVKTEGDYSEYADAGRVSVFADSAMRWAVGNGIIKGKTDGTILDPQGDTSRAETAILLVRYQGISA